jgi:hypothetical protein
MSKEENTLGIGPSRSRIVESPKKWHEVYRGDDEKCVFVGKDGASGLIRAKDKDGKRYEWRSTDALSRESGLSKKRVEEILDHWCKKGVVRQNAKDPEKWGYWEIVGQAKSDPDIVGRDHQDRMEKQFINNGQRPPGKKPILPSGQGQPTGGLAPTKNGNSGTSKGHPGKLSPPIFTAPVAPQNQPVSMPITPMKFRKK